MLVAALVLAACSLIHLPRKAAAAVVMVALTILAVVVYPAASVYRAWFMGMVMCACHWIGRPFQVMSTLCWTVIVTLAVEPAMSTSLAFALSSAAVFSIALLAESAHRTLFAWLPGGIGRVLAWTLCAQLGAQPIQVLIEPSLPVWALLANQCVAPVITGATLLGLAALVVAPFSTELAWLVAWLASAATWIMERCARWLGSGEHAVIPWMGGVGGALMLLFVEVALVLLVWRLRLIVRRRRRSAMADSLLGGESIQDGESIQGDAGAAIRRCFADTRAEFASFVQR